jgi:Putative prokaryotic signal transducing protein
MNDPMDATDDTFEPEWETIFTTSSEVESHLIKGLLEGEGIPCRLHSMRVPQFPLTVNALGTIEVHVRPQDAPEGRRILYMICSAGKPQNTPEQPPPSR